MSIGPKIKRDTGKYFIFLGLQFFIFLDNKDLEIVIANTLNYGFNTEQSPNHNKNSSANKFGLFFTNKMPHKTSFNQ